MNADRVKDTTSTTGTGAITCAGAPPTGYQALSACGTTGATFAYLIEGGAEWEVGTGTITGTNTFSRSVLKSSNANALVNFSAGTKNVYCSLSVDELLAGVMTLTNKRISPRVVTVAASATPTINTDNGDVFRITGQNANITSMTTNLTGTASHGELIEIEITDNGSARTILWGTAFEASTVALPTTTVASAMLSITFKRNSATSKWRCVGVA